MKQLLQSVFVILVLSGVIFFSCKKEDTIISTVNKTPIANAGPDQSSILPKDSVELNGSSSMDPDGSIVKYQWTKISGPAAFSIVNPAVVTTMVRNLAEGVYKFELRVTDNRGAVDMDTVQVTVTTGNGINHAPVAVAGPDKVLSFSATSCTLNGSNSYDPDGTISSFLWTKLSGPAINIVNPAVAQTQVTGMVGGTYSFMLMVTDNGGLTAKDTVQVTIYNCDLSNRAQRNVVLSQIGTLSVPRSPAVAAAGDKIIFAGGQNASYTGVSDVVDIYDTKTQLWSHAQLSQARWQLTAVSCGNKVFFAGGSSHDNIYDNVDIYDVAKNEWTLAHLSEARASLAAGTVGSKVIFAGGLTDGFFDQSNRVDIYDTLTGQWSTASLYEAKYGMTAVTAGEKIYFAGGWNWNSGNEPMNTIDIYDNANSGHWSRGNLYVLSGGVSGLAINNTIYWAGVSTQNVGEIEIWNTQNNTSTSGCLSYVRIYPTVVSTGNEIAFFTPGRFIVYENFPATIDIYNPVTGAWSIGIMNQGIAGAAVISRNNQVYMGGGKLNSGQFTDKVYLVNW